jgi:periplasmic protein TonB
MEDQMASHLMHLFNPAQKSPSREGRPVRLSPATSNDVFLRALLETPTTKTVRRSPLQWAAATSLHVVILATLIIVPLYTTGTIQLDKYADTLLVAPPPAPPPPPPAAGRAMAPHITSTRPKLTYTLGKLTAPASVPKTISWDNAGAAPDLGGVPGGVPGGQPGGSLGGVIGGTGTSVPIPSPQQPAAKRILRVGSNLKAPRQIYSVQPQYPELARQAHVWGVVVVRAVIDEQGNVVQAHALSGHPLLIPAALKAVLQWKYEPTLLNRTPVAVEMEVTVHFNLGNS